MSRILAICLLLLFQLSSYGQNETDLFRFSKTTYHGSARFEGMGGSFGALGADLSSSQINPAGYGRFSSSQAGISFFGAKINNNSLFNSVSTNENSGSWGVGTLGVVFAQDVSENSKGFLFQQFGFGYNQIEDFNSEFTYEGQQFSSLLDQFESQAQGYFPEELSSYFAFSTDLAYKTGSIKYNSTGQYFYSLLSPGDVYHNRTFKSKGGISDYFFSWSGNYLNKLYIGGNVGLRNHRYIEKYTHSESLLDTSGTPLRSFEYEYDLKTKGSGVNVKIGMIYLINESFRFGLALHTPTFSELKDKWSAKMTSYYQDSVSLINDSLVPEGEYKYRIRNAGRIVGSFAYVIGTRGCINLDAEIMDYRHAHFRTTTDDLYSPYDYEFENEFANEVFQPAFNFRIGSEYMIFSGFFVRAGFARYGNAFKDNYKAELKPDLTISGGLGYKWNNLSFDLAFSRRQFSRNYYAFSGSMTEVNTTIFNGVISGSYNF